MDGRVDGVDEGAASEGAGLRVGLYCVMMLVAYRLATYGVGGVAVQFLYKERFGLSASQMSLYNAATDVPFFVGFLFGFLRDRVRPRGWGDRAYFLVGALAIMTLDLTFAFGEPSLGKLVAFGVGSGAVAALLGAAASGLLAAVAKEHGMAGRLAVAGLLAARGASIFASSAGGWIDGRFGYRAAFFASSVAAIPLLALAFWRPRAVFRAEGEAFATVVPEGAGAAVRRLVRHQAVFVPAIVLFLWDFAPGWGTPLFYHLTNGPLKHGAGLSEAQYGTSQSLINLGTLLASLAYIGLCRRFPLRSLLVVGTVLGVLGCPLFLLIHGVAMAYGISLLAGLSMGVALGAFYDLLYRSCPKELEGVAAMLTMSALIVAGDASDVFGSWLYDRGGFGLALAVSTLFSALILPVLAFVPRSITAPPEGERLVDADPPRGEPMPAA